MSKIYSLFDSFTTLYVDRMHSIVFTYCIAMKLIYYSVKRRKEIKKWILGKNTDLDSLS